jgi:hypothetical protein
MTEPFTRNKDWHLDPKTNLGVKKWGHVVMIRKVTNKFLVSTREVVRLLCKRYASGIHHCEVISHHFQDFDTANTVRGFPHSL